MLRHRPRARQRSPAAKTIQTSVATPWRKLRIRCPQLLQSRHQLAHPISRTRRARFSGRAPINHNIRHLPLRQQFRRLTLQWRGWTHRRRRNRTPLRRRQLRCRHPWIGRRVRRRLPTLNRRLHQLHHMRGRRLHLFVRRSIQLPSLEPNDTDHDHHDRAKQRLKRWHAMHSWVAICVFLTRDAGLYAGRE